MRLHALIIATALSVAACEGTNGEAGPSDPSAANDQIGNLELNLTGADSDGRQYRLRSAEFLITSNFLDPYPPPRDGGSSYFETTVSSEDNLDQARITLRVVPGYYSVSLTSGDWYLERIVDGSWQRVEQAVLLSSAYQSAFVYNQGTVPVNFRFGVDGEVIDFRAGDISIGIEIEQPGEGPGDAGFPGGGIFGGLLGGTFGGIAGGGIPGGGGFDAGAPTPAE